MNNLELFVSIKSTVKRIETDLYATNNTGIYFAPELYVAFCIGQDIYKNRNNIFGVDEVKWLREYDLKNGGPSDIVFKHNDSYTIIELKLRDKDTAYIADIEKLSRLNGNYSAYFCVLADSFSELEDERLTGIEKTHNRLLSRIKQDIFPTWSDWYKRKIYCHLNLYSVISKAEVSIRDF